MERAGRSFVTLVDPDVRGSASGRNRVFASHGSRHHSSDRVDTLLQGRSSSILRRDGAFHRNRRPSAHKRRILRELVSSGGFARSRSGHQRLLLRLDLGIASARPIEADLSLRQVEPALS